MIRFLNVSGDTEPSSQAFGKFEYVQESYIRILLRSSLSRILDLEQSSSSSG